MEGVLIYKTYTNNWSQYDVSEANEIKKKQFYQVDLFEFR